MKFLVTAIMAIMLSMSAQAYPNMKTHKKSMKTHKTGVKTLSAATLGSPIVKNNRLVVNLTSDNALVLNQAFTSSSVATLMKEATAMDSKLKSGYPMYLVLYTPGGSIQAGLELYDFLEGLNRPIHTITMFAASMGFQTVQHLGERYITRYGVLMAHKARGGFRGEFGGGASQLDSRYGMWLRRVEMMDKQTVERSKQIKTLRQFYSMYAPELWLNGQEAVDVGLADAVAIIKCDATLAGTKDVIYNLGFIKLAVEYSACPARTAPLGIRVSLLTNKGQMDLDTFLVKNGKFGKKCKEAASGVERDWNGRVIGKGKPAQLCATDKKLTYDKIQKVKENKLIFLNRDLKTNIIGYFGESIK